MYRPTQPGMPGMLDLVSQQSPAPSSVPAQAPSGGKGGGIRQGLSDFANPERMARMTMALNSMRTRPDRSMALNAAATIQEARRNQQREQQANRTADWLESQGASEYAQMARQGFAGEALKAYQADRSGNADFANQVRLKVLEASLRNQGRETAVVDGNLVDVNSGETIFSAPKDPLEGINVGAGRLPALDENGNIVAETIPGTEAAREEEAAAELKRNQNLRLGQMRRLVEDVISDRPALEVYSGVSGSIPGRRGLASVTNPDYKSWMGKLSRVLGSLTLEELNKMKGTASESDMIKVEQAASSLAAGGTMEENMRALRDIYEVLGGDPSTLPSPQGERSVWEKTTDSFSGLFGGGNEADIDALVNKYAD